MPFQPDRASNQSLAGMTFDGKPIDVSIPANADTGEGEFCTFVLFRTAAK